MVNPAHIFTLILDRMDGIGNVSIHRFLDHFSSLEALQSMPREQVLARIKGIPNANEIVSRLFDSAFINELKNDVIAEIQNLEKYRVRLLTPAEELWPAGLNAIEATKRPYMMYCHGNTASLNRPSVAILGRSPLTEKGFDLSQTALSLLLEASILPIAGAHDGFDVALHKIAAHGSPPSASAMFISSGGLATIAPPLRPVATAIVRANGMLLSPFGMNHKSFPYEERQGLLYMGLLSNAVLFVEPERETPYWRVLEKLTAYPLPLFAIPHPQHAVPEAVHVLQSREDIDWLIAALPQN